MALNKQTVNINFFKGLDTKTDKFQVALGNFLDLKNSIFDKTGQLTKRNGFSFLSPLDNSATYLTTFNGNLTAIGDMINVYSSGSETWTTKGQLLPVKLDTLSLIRSNLQQTQVDVAIAPNNLVCTIYTDNPAGAPSYRYAISDLITGQNIVPPSVIQSGGGGNVLGSPRVFLLGNYFILVYTNVISGTSHLTYSAINIYNPTMVIGPTDIVSSYTSATTLSWDGLVSNNNLFIAFNTVTGGQSIKVIYLNKNLVLGTELTFAGQIATLMTMSEDLSTPLPTIYISYYDASSQLGYTLAVQSSTGGSLSTILTPTEIISAEVVANMASTADNGICTFFYEITNAYTYDSSIPTNYININTITQSGTVGTSRVLVRSVGLASKAFSYNGISYFLAAYQSVNQPSYFLINDSGLVVSKLAYSNGGGYLTVGLPNAIIKDNVVHIPYRINDLIQSTNKTQGNPTSSAVYTQTGLSLATFTIGSSNLTSAEIGGDLFITGGFLWQYDGYLPVENGFFIWPDNVELNASGSGGSITAQQYYYQVIYEWTDNQGNIFRSAPSIPVSVTTTGSSSSITVNVPTLRLTYKLANPVKISIFRWSTANQVYYEVTSNITPTLNNPAIDSIAFIDTLADTAIIGNSIIYTTGGVIENISTPATNIITLFNNRLWALDSEDKNLWWFSKQVIEGTSVDMSDLLTYYVAPTTGSQGSTGPITAGSAMDDKLITFKANAIYYTNGTGPDNTGANNQYSDPLFITSTVGCANQQSIVFTPRGLMFQSDKGIWLLGRDLNTTYIGAPVESFTLGAIVLSALNIPETNQVRFTLDSGITLMYDYYFDQWGTFVGIPGVSSTLYQDLHTFINSSGEVLQESPGQYLDGTRPVLLSFTTSWINLAGLQGYERFYQGLLLGQYITPFKLNVQFAYDYNASPQYNTIINPNPHNFAGSYGSDNLWGGGPNWGGQSNVLEERIFPNKQKVESFQLIIDEIYDNSYGVVAGAGLTLSGLALTVGIKKGYRIQSAARSS